MAQLKCIHIHAKEGLRVDAPGLDIEGLEYGKMYEIPDAMVDVCLKTGNWERLAEATKPVKKKEESE